jgi:hypothetical protein
MISWKLSCFSSQSSSPLYSNALRFQAPVLPLRMVAPYLLALSFTSFANAGHDGLLGSTNPDATFNVAFGCRLGHGHTLGSHLVRCRAGDISVRDQSTELLQLLDHRNHGSNASSPQIRKKIFERLLASLG